ncbi:MAG: L-seryl-tRNA(Sec) selenium transferase [Sphingomonadales bacterium]|nr:L-seryl-tRNA(Sec) selenium transferase [Sphingomonadales bacterium]
MPDPTPAAQALRPPSIDSLLRAEAGQALVAVHGHAATVAALRAAVAVRRARGASDATSLLADAAARLDARAAPMLKRVFNLTGTVLHTNLGRAILSEAAIGHASMAMREACNLEFDIGGGGRGERDTLVEQLLAELTGAEAATVVNNNAAAVLLMLAALAEGREIVVSRGELVEIGGAFRIPDVMRAAQARLVEVGTTNRTHARDYARAIGTGTAALMKVHASNYRVVGFTSSVSEAEVARIAHGAGLPLLVDLGAGSLVDLRSHGLPHEPVVREIIAAGADLVTFSGDKLLGGPQAGIIVGRRDLVELLRRHPLKRALRVSKIILAALEGTLLAYRRPDRLARELPTLRWLTRPRDEIRAQAQALVPRVAAALGDGWSVTTADVASQVGSGSLPGEAVPSVALAIAPGSGSAAALDRLVAGLRAAPVPVIGRVADDRLLLDLRCLTDADGLVAQFARLEIAP